MNLFSEMLKELRAEQSVPVIYGAHELARKIGCFLAKNGFDYIYAVDSAYLPESRVFAGKPLRDLAEVLAEGSCDIIIGIYQFPEARITALRENPGVRRVYALDFNGRFAIGEENDGLFTEEFLAANADTLRALRADLCDEESRLQLDAFIAQRASGQYRKRHSENMQYFDPDVMPLTAEEVLVDCGAYTGDSVSAFLEALGGRDYRAVYAFEADADNAAEMRRTVGGLHDLHIIEKGVYSHTGRLVFGGSGSSARLSDSGTAIEVTTLDDALADADVTLIKMDIEGSELAALQGAEKLIRRCRPKLAVCVYHRPEDLITIPQYIRALVPEYRLYFRSYLDHGTESVIYAIPE